MGYISCPECGQQIVDASRFCLNCGYKLSKEELHGVEKKPKKPFDWKILSIIGIGVIIVALVVGFIFYNSLASTKYNRAEKAFANANYKKALKNYEAAGDYKDALDKYAIAEQAYHYQNGVELIESKNYADAIDELTQAAKYEDATTYINECHYEIALGYKGENDYVNAAQEFQTANGYKDSDDLILEMGQELTESGSYKEAVQVFKEGGVSSNYYIYAQAMVAYTDKDYKNASSLFSKCTSVLDASNLYNESEYLYAQELLDSENYGDAKSALSPVADYQDAANLINCCDLMLANEEIENGNLSSALSTLKTLPTDLVYKDASVSESLALLNANSQWVALCGKWTSTSGQMRSTQSGSYRDTWWYRDFSKGEYSIDVRCLLNSDGTVTIKTDGSIPVYLNYSSISSLLQTGTKSVSIDKTVSSMGNVKVDNYTTISFSSSGVNVEYYEKDNSQDVYFTYIYKTSISYGKKSTSY